MSGMTHDNQIQGTLEQIRYEKDGFCIAALADGTVVKGSLISPEVGQEYRFQGTWEKHAKFGKQFKFISCQILDPTTLASVQAWLDRAPHVGPEISKALVKAYGLKAIKVCMDDPERVARDINWITPERALKVSDYVRAHEAERKRRAELDLLCAGAKITDKAIAQILDEWGEEAAEMIRENPYQLIGKFDRIAFPSADQVAQNVSASLGKPEQDAMFVSPERLRAGIRHTLEEKQNRGHTCLPSPLFEQDARKLMHLDLQESTHLTDEIGVATEDGMIVQDGGTTALGSVFADEAYIAQRLVSLGGPAAPPYRIVNDDLQVDQRDALDKICRHGVLILTGSPGTGKTFTIKRIISTFVGATIKLAAPTGMAAKKIVEHTGMEAQTIHRLLEPQPENKNGRVEWNFARNKDNPIEASLIVIDEMSMVDVWLMARLLEAVAPGTRLILIGDRNQLLPVGAGNVLRDALDSGLIATTELNTIKRQNPGMIIQNCQHIKHGEDIASDNAGDFYFFERDSEEDIRDMIVELVTKTIPATHSKINARWDVQVIVPRRNETQGVLSCLVLPKLNKDLQSVLNPYGMQFGRFRIGDKVIQNENVYDLMDDAGMPVTVLNGDIGEILAVGRKVQPVDPQTGEPDEEDLEDEAPDKIFIRVEFKNPARIVNIAADDSKLDLAYAITCHKFQGNEAKIVIIPVHRSGRPVLQRNWLYTAVSRAKDVCYLVGTRDEVRTTIQQHGKDVRYTRLRPLIVQEARARAQMVNTDMAGAGSP